MSNEQNTPYFDVAYGIASAKVTAGSNIVATTAVSYHGISLVAGVSDTARVFIYDSIAATTGNLVDMFVVRTGDSIWIDRFIPVYAKVGLVISVTGVGAQGAVFYGPKG